MLRTRVKICGMTKKEDIACAVDLGVDSVGLIFYPKSSRYVTVEQAKKLLEDIPAFITVTAVLVNPDKAVVEQIINELPVDLVQFHGDESPEFCHQFNKPYIKAIPANSTSYIQQMTHQFSQAKAILLDTPSPLSKGGTGLTFDWRIIPPQSAMPYILAGGLNAGNVMHAVNSCHPYAVDVCSGVEASPGVKNHQQMNEFIKALCDTQAV